MKKIFYLLLITALITTTCLLSGCGSYKSIKGYEAYISDRDNGFGWVSNFAISPVNGKENQQNAKYYYLKNVRRCGEYLVTDYENGICINRYYGNKTILDIPETLENKPVVKIGSYYKNNKENDFTLFGAFSNVKNGTLNMPSTVKYVTAEALTDTLGIHIKKINADKDNPYYSSKEGTLYTREYDERQDLIFISLEGKKEFTVKEPVWNFQPCNGISADWKGHISFDSEIYIFNTYVADSNGVELKENSKIKPQFTTDDYGDEDFEKLVKRYGIKTVS